MEYDPKPYRSSGRIIDPTEPTRIGLVDPRTTDGELLLPERFTREAVEALKVFKGSYGYAGQYQQRPTAREGGLFKRQWFEDKIIRQAPPGTRWVRHWDFAATKKTTAARTTGAKLGKAPDGSYVVGHVVTTQDEGDAVRRPDQDDCGARRNGRDDQSAAGPGAARQGAGKGLRFDARRGGW
ncbi:hypothetical protein ABID21_001356 [Pseudorhizobium tarimense]|uniref:Uncharacterized protein n=1 Tax=Pseudorhizobium tarimense TaxID=1079109 RepID=A0ABV2H3X3_9HYPH|nr:hypothetical protein [Pseudorhizobium tarimense]MCJ8518333.1 hypothetical protein [Pseudorhizobium tarimense]